MLIPSDDTAGRHVGPSLSRRVNANSQLNRLLDAKTSKLIKKGEC